MSQNNILRKQVSKIILSFKILFETVFFFFFNKIFETVKTAKFLLKPSALAQLLQSQIVFFPKRIFKMLKEIT